MPLLVKHGQASEHAMIATTNWSGPSNSIKLEERLPIYLRFRSGSPIIATGACRPFTHMKASVGPRHIMGPQMKTHRFLTSEAERFHQWSTLDHQSRKLYEGALPKLTIAIIKASWLSRGNQKPFDPWACGAIQHGNMVQYVQSSLQYNLPQCLNNSI